MPAISTSNSTDAYEWLANGMLESDQSRMQTLLLQILPIVLAAASLAIACVHFAHQRRLDGLEHDQQRMSYLVALS